MSAAAAAAAAPSPMPAAGQPQAEVLTSVELVTMVRGMAEAEQLAEELRAEVQKAQGRWMAALKTANLAREGIAKHLQVGEPVSVRVGRDAMLTLRKLDARRVAVERSTIIGVR